MYIDAISKNRRVICFVEDGNSNTGLIKSYKFLSERNGEYQNLFEIAIYRDNIDAYIALFNIRDLYANWNAIEEYLNSRRMYSRKFSYDGNTYLKLNIDESFKKNIQSSGFKRFQLNIAAELNHVKEHRLLTPIIDGRKDVEIPLRVTFY